MEYQLVMIPTREKSNLFFDTIEEGKLIYDPNYVDSNIHWKDVKHQNLYILSDDPILEHDYHVAMKLIATNPDQCIAYTDKQQLKAIADIGGAKKIVAASDVAMIIRYDNRFADVSVNNRSLNNTLAKINKELIVKFVEEYNRGHIITSIVPKTVYDKNPEFYGTGMFNTGKLILELKDNIAVLEKTSYTKKEMENFGKLVLDTFRSETDSGKHKLVMERYDSWFKGLTI